MWCVCVECVNLVCVFECLRVLCVVCLCVECVECVCVFECLSVLCV